jgi:hypothetical protein
MPGNLICADQTKSNRIDATKQLPRDLLSDGRTNLSLRKLNPSVQQSPQPPGQGLMGLFLRATFIIAAQSPMLTPLRSGNGGLPKRSVLRKSSHQLKKARQVPSPPWAIAGGSFRPSTWRDTDLLICDGRGATTPCARKSGFIVAKRCPRR